MFSYSGRRVISKPVLNRSLFPVVFSLAWPTMLQELMDTAVQYIDTAMVGSIGTRATAAVGSTVTVGWLVISSVAALGVGFLSYIAKAYGAGEKSRAGDASAQALLVVLLAGTVLTAAMLSLSTRIPIWMKVTTDVRDLASAYFFILYLPMLPRTAEVIFGMILRASGDTRTPLRVGICVNLTNIILNFFLIYHSRSILLAGFPLQLYGAGLGVRGAAIASAVSVTLGGVLMTAALWRHKELSPRGRSILPRPEILKPCLRVALPNMLQRFCTSLGYVVFASMINSLGQISVAAHTIANTVESAFYVPGYGMQSAAATLTGNAIGAKDQKRMQELSTVIIVLEFSSDQEVIALSSFVLRLVALSEPFYGISIVTEGMLQGAGETAKPFLFNVLCMWGVRILGTFLCIHIFHLGLVSAWVCMIADNMLLLILFRLFFHFGSWRSEIDKV